MWTLGIELQAATRPLMAFNPVLLGGGRPYSHQTTLCVLDCSQGMPPDDAPTYNAGFGCPGQAPGTPVTQEDCDDFKECT